MKIGILQTGHSPDDLAEQFGSYGQMFVNLLGAHELDAQVWSVIDGQYPDDINAVDGWLVTGSKHGAYEDLPWIAPLENLIREISNTDLPMVGICFGHQIIAQALGGKVVKFPRGWSVGVKEYAWNGTAETITLNAWHQDQVVEKPAAAKVLAGNEFCENAALKYGEQILTFQPHPEFTKEFINGLIQYRAIGIVPDDLLAQATARLEVPTDSLWVQNMIVEHFRNNYTER